MADQNNDVKKEKQPPKKIDQQAVPPPRPRQATQPLPPPARPPHPAPPAAKPPEGSPLPKNAGPKTPPAGTPPATAPEKRVEKRKPKPDSEQVRLKKEEQARRSRRRNRQIIGVAVTILVIVGAVSIVMNGITMARNVFDSSGEIEEYENRFKAFVWFDVLPFESVTQVDENSLKQVVIWSIFDDQSEQLERNDYGEAQVPASEVDRYGADLFGPDFRFSAHDSFEDLVFDLEYTYDPETLMYSVPSTGLNPNYLPTVVEVIREPGGVRRVIMGYVSTRTSDNQVVQTPDYDHPARYMDYMLRRDGSNYYLFAIQKNETYVPESGASSGSASASLPVQESLPALEDPLLSGSEVLTDASLLPETEAQQPADSVAQNADSAA